MTSEEFINEVRIIRPALILQARHNLGADEEEAEDVVQDALLRLWKIHPELKSPMSKMAAIVVRNLAVDRLRQKQKWKAVTIPPPDEECTDDERINRILNIIESLPPMQQMVLRLRHMEGMEMKDIAEITGTSEVAVRKTLSRARQSVRNKYFTNKGNDDE